ncbi:hypothetical protein M8J77_000097 [Diaphorina citri]|nr:hypothetical protein M8J77_000097 [Diaphorina citri]
MQRALSSYPSILTPLTLLIYTLCHGCHKFTIRLWVLLLYELTLECYTLEKEEEEEDEGKEEEEEKEDEGKKEEEEEADEGKNTEKEEYNNLQ